MHPRHTAFSYRPDFLIPALPLHGFRISSQLLHVHRAPVSAPCTAEKLILHQSSRLSVLNQRGSVESVHVSSRRSPPGTSAGCASPCTPLARPVELPSLPSESIPGPPESGLTALLSRPQDAAVGASAPLPRSSRGVVARLTSSVSDTRPEHPPCITKLVSSHRASSTVRRPGSCRTDE